MSSFFNPSHMAWVEDARFRINVRGEKVRAGRKILIVSTKDLTTAQKEELRKKYLQEYTLSFPLKERASHLMTRIDQKVFNYGRFIFNWWPQFRVRDYAIPRSKAMELVLQLTSEERGRLQQYLQNILKNRRRTIGPFHMEGHQHTEGKLDRNATTKGGHNCSSWIATAPLGKNNEPLLELLGGDRELLVGTNPGWWTNWLAATAPQERVPFILLWTTETLTDALLEVQSGKNFPWDFNRH